MDDNLFFAVQEKEGVSKGFWLAGYITPELL